MDLQRIADAAKEAMEFVKFRTGFVPYSMRGVQGQVSREQADTAQWDGHRISRDGKCVFHLAEIDGIRITAEVDIGEYTEDEIRAISKEAGA